MPPLNKGRSKPRDIKRLIVLYFTWTAITVIVVSILTGFVFSLPIWQTSSVKVAGNNYLPEAKIVSTAKIPVGENIFLIDLDEVKNRFSDIIQIKDVKVRRKLPGTIIIEIKERTPFAIAVIEGTTSLVDDDGYIVATRNLGSSIYRSGIAKCPVIRGINKKSLEKGVRLNAADRMFARSALNMLSKFMDIGTIQMDVGNREDIIIYVEDILKVKIGDQNEIERKIRIIKALLSSVTGKWNKVAYIDVRVPDSPVIRFR